MKTFKFILLTLLLMCGLIAHAQKVVVYKADGTKVEYNASEVKDVKYKKAEVVYYWYLSTVKPTSEDDIKTSGTTTNSALTSIDIPVTNAYKYFVYPSEWGTPTFIDPATKDVISLTNFTDILSISNYDCRRGSKALSGELNITWSK